MHQPVNVQMCIYTVYSLSPCTWYHNQKGDDLG